MYSTQKLEACISITSTFYAKMCTSGTAAYIVFSRITIWVPQRLKMRENATIFYRIHGKVANKEHCPRYSLDKS